ncbi:hypothetical protein EHI44_25655 [Rhizobium leguminosarum]|uniref:hypothetical protein n=1 Tax=Rhizobium leguminosarum TaxID=384 RepID=UPI00027D9093|nr:hypothetical protein [Rhizobium leguminosarum]QND14050.1 hypothetical protein HB775_09315 [Rhizobium leguminosarum bv. trifolii]RWY82230.1 hypothetical protein EHI44_25655 [Rhizobium leguminosarum]
MTTIRTLEDRRIGRFGLLAKAAASGSAFADTCYEELCHGREWFPLRPLEKLVNRRWLIIGQLLILAAALAFAAAASPMSALVAASLIAAAGSTAAYPGYSAVPILNRRDGKRP